MSPTASSRRGQVGSGLSALFRTALALPVRLFPRRFRQAYGLDMLELFELRCSEEWQRGGAFAATRLFGRSLVDLLATAAAERRNSSFGHNAGNPDASKFPAHRKGDGFVSTLLQDLKFSLRAFRRQPSFTAVVVVTLALGIGANTAIFSVVNGVLLRPLPYDESDNLIDVWGRFDPVSGFDYPTFPLSPPEFVDYRAQSRAMEDVAAFSTFSVTITTGDGDPERVTAGSLSANAFELLRVEPLLGRPFTAEEDNEGADVVVLEYGYWQTRFGADPDIVGETIMTNGRPSTVLGVMPDGFQFVRGARMWAPIGIDAENPGNRQAHYVLAFGRLAPGSTLAQADAEMGTLMAAWKGEYPEIHTGHYLYLSPMIEDVVGSIRPALMMLLAAAGLVLLIVCANVASVLLARGEGRLKEVAVRSAMGAGRWQIVRLLLCESFVLATVGGTVGVLLSIVGVAALIGVSAGSIPRVDAISVDATVLGFGALMTFATAVMFGLFPALHSAATDVHSNLKEGLGTTSPSRTRLYFRRGLVVAEVALSFLLVLCASLMLQSFGAIVSTDPGFRSDNIVVASLSLPSAQYEDSAAVQAFYAELLERVDGLPGVVAAAAASSLPLNGAPGVWDFRVDGKPLPGPGEPAWNAAFSTARPGFFEAMGARLDRGRLFDGTDTADAQLVTVVNQSLVDKFFAGEDPLGQRIMVCCPNEDQEAPWMTIVGVIDDMRYQGLSIDPRPAYYAVHQQVEEVSYGSAFRSMTLAVRTEGDPLPVAASLRGLVQELDPLLPVIGLQTMDDVVAASVARPWFISRLLGLFGAVALLLGATGIYGVLAYMVAQRSREIGIRKALGAAQGELAGMVIAQGMSLVLVGLLIGIAASFWVTQLLTSLLFGVNATDPVTYLMVCGALTVVALGACGVPTLRAVRVDPLVALRTE